MDLVGDAQEQDPPEVSDAPSRGEALLVRGEQQLARRRFRRALRSLADARAALAGESPQQWELLDHVEVRMVEALVGLHRGAEALELAEAIITRDRRTALTDRADALLLAYWWRIFALLDLQQLTPALEGARDAAERFTPSERAEDRRLVAHLLLTKAKLEAARELSDAARETLETLVAAYAGDGHPELAGYVADARRQLAEPESV